MKAHPAAELFPMMPDGELEALAEDIKVNGLSEPIVLHDGKVLDGRNRAEACRRAGVKPTTQVWKDPGCGPLLWVLSLNLRRRQMSKSQSACLAVKLLPELEAEAEARRIEKRSGNPRPQIVADERESREAAAELVQVNRQYVSDAKKLASEDADLFEQVWRGELSLQEAKTKLKADARKADRREAVVTGTGTAEIAQGDAVKFLKRQRSIDLLLTDPPFSSDVDDIEGFVGSWLPTALDRMSPEGRAYVFCGAYTDELIAYLDTFRRHPWAHGIQLLGWNYMNTLGPQPAMGYLRNWQAIVYAHGPDAPRINSDRLVELVSIFQSANPARSQDRVHKWQKPDDLAEMFVRHGTQEGQTVIDPFAGSGTFLAAAARIGRHGRGVDMDPQAVELAVDRGIVRV